MFQLGLSETCSINLVQEFSLRAHRDGKNGRESSINLDQIQTFNDFPLHSNLIKYVEAYATSC